MPISVTVRLGSPKKVRFHGKIAFLSKLCAYGKGRKRGNTIVYGNEEGA